MQKAFRGREAPGPGYGSYQTKTNAEGAMCDGKSKLLYVSKPHGVQL